eukprot:gene22179-30420_t
MKISGPFFANAKRDYQKKSVILTLNESLNQHISVFKYGSVVLFNIPNENHLECLNQIKEAAVASIADDEPRFKDDYKIVVNDKLDKPSVVKAEHLNIRILDKNNITIVGTVMAQAIALEYYAVELDRQLEIFMKMNANIQSSKNFRNMDDQELIKMVASNNIVMTNVLSKIGLFEGSDAAWDNADYHYTWEALRKDFELDATFKDFDLKIDIIKNDTRFFLEVLHNKKTSKAEWYIIGLIAFEISISIFDIIKHSL